MIHSRTTRQFWHLFSALPVDVQRDAKRAYRLFQSNPAHPGLTWLRSTGTCDPAEIERISLDDDVFGDYSWEIGIAIDTPGARGASSAAHKMPVFDHEHANSAYAASRLRTIQNCAYCTGTLTALPEIQAALT